MAAVFRKGHFRMEMRLQPLDGELAAEDRQCAWELYCEMVSRSAVCGTLDAEGKEFFEHELLIESLRSFKEFADEARTLVRRFPAGRAGATAAATEHLGWYIARLLAVAIEPFLEKWHARFCHWWETDGLTAPRENPFARQRRYDFYSDLVAEWTWVRVLCRDIVAELRGAYGFAALLDAVPQHVREEWRAESAELARREAQAAQARARNG
jgi:hypothetical protein